MSTSDTNDFPDSARMEGNQKVGIKDSGFIDKKGTPSGEGARFNQLPPGGNIENQKVADIRPQELKNYRGGTSFPDDGWD